MRWGLIYPGPLTFGSALLVFGSFVPFLPHTTHTRLQLLVTPFIISGTAAETKGTDISKYLDLKIADLFPLAVWPDVTYFPIPPAAHFEHTTTKFFVVAKLTFPLVAFSPWILQNNSSIFHPDPYCVALNL